MVLAAAEAQEHDVQPIYVSCGLPWEPIEQAFLARFLAEYRAPHAFLPLARLELPVGDVYPPTHWAIRGVPPPLTRRTRTSISLVETSRF